MVRQGTEYLQTRQALIILNALIVAASHSHGSRDLCLCFFALHP